METLIIHADREKIRALKQFLKAFNISFEKDEKIPYNQEFVDKVLMADKDIEDGKGIKIPLEDLWK